MPNYFDSYANLKARFIKAANGDGTQNKEESYWEIWLGSELLVKITVEELCNMSSILSYDLIATKEFGAEMLAQIKKSKYDFNNSI